MGILVPAALSRQASPRVHNHLSLGFAASLVGMLASSIALPANAELNDTGFYLCRDFAAAVDQTACKGTGQDGAIGRDRAFPSDADGWKGFTFRKVCNSGELEGTGSCPVNPIFGGSGMQKWSCVLDAWTGLTWEAKLSSNDPVRGAQRIFSFSDGSVSEYVATMNANRLCGHDNWRLPTPGEALGLANYAVAYTIGRPMIDQTFFRYYSDFSYWTLSQQGGLESTWVTGYNPAGTARTSGFGLYAIRVVRDAVALPQLSVRPDGSLLAVEGEVVDEANGLTWARCSVGQRWNGLTQTCDGKAKRLSWPQAVAYAKREASATGVAWRIPNIKELFSIVDTVSSARGAKVNSEDFPRTAAAPYWTSTPTTLPTNVLRMIDFKEGNTTTASQQSNYLRLVR